MKRFLNLLLLTLFCIATIAQNKSVVTGQLIGKHSEQPIEYASVAIYSVLPHSLISGTVTDSIGYFNFQNIPSGNYELKVSYVGCSDFTTKPFQIKQGSNIELGKFLIDDSSQSLEEVTVTGKRSTYQQTIDKKVFVVGNDLASGSGAVSELLQNVPSVQVDMEGTVSLRGNENVLILINGKPSALTNGANRGTVLQQIPASSIERIEVITNPSAQFKPDGTSGIINLILKKEKAKGVNGNVMANVGNKKRYNSGISLGINSSHWNITGNYGFRKDRRDRYNLNDRTIFDGASESSVNQRSQSWAPSTSHIGGLGVQWAPSDNDEFEANGNYTYMKFPREERTLTVQNDNLTKVKDFSRIRNDKEHHENAEASLSYAHTFSKSSKLSADYKYSFQNEVEDNHYSNVFSFPVAATTFDNTLIKQKSSNHLARLIFSNHLNDNNIITSGFEMELNNSDCNYFAEDFTDGAWNTNTQKTNHFLYNQHLYSAYTTWENSANRLSWLVGIRGEYSNDKSNLVTSNEVVKSNAVMLFPSLHTSFALNDYSELQLNYSLRLNRPTGNDLNPFPEYQDPYNLRAGNPYLKPEKIHSLEFGWQYKRNATTFILTPYYRYTFNKFTSITKVLPDGVLMRTKQNMSSSSASGAELILNSSFGKWCNFNLSSNIFYNTIDASDLGYSNVKGSMAWYISLNSDFNIYRNLMLQLNSRYNSSMLTPQGKLGSTYIVNLGARYDIPRYKLSFSAVISDLFDSFTKVVIIDTPLIKQRLERKKNPRTFYIGLSYHFGTHKSSKKEKSLNYDESL